MKLQPLVSIVILNWNGKDRLKKCLNSVKKISYSKKEIIVVNNGSTDGSKNFLQKYHPEIKVIELKKNVGYARGKNMGVSKSKGKYILALDNDTAVTSNFLEPLVDAMEKDKSIGIIQPQIRSMIHKNLLDSVGSFMTATGFLYHFGYMKPYSRKIYQIPLYAYSIKGACFIISKKDYLELGGLDESFLSYVEETDLCHRLWLSGKKVMYEPKSIISHWGGGDTLTMSTSESSTYRSFRNRYYSYLKNFSLIELMKIMPIHIIMCEMYVFLSLLTGKFKQAAAVQSGSVYWIFKLPSILKKRSYIQKNIRKLKDKDLNRFIRREPRLSYYWYVAKNIKAYKD